MKTTIRSIPTGVPNRNGRIYSEDMMRKAIDDYNLKQHAKVGQLGHPEMADDISLTSATHIVKNVALRKLKVPRKLKKKMKKAGIYNSTKQIYVDIKYLPLGHKTIRGILASFPNSLTLGPSMEAVVNPDGTPDVKRIITFNFIHKKDSAFKKYL